jgi:hypothetical protein
MPLACNPCVGQRFRRDRVNTELLELEIYPNQGDVFWTLMVSEMRFDDFKLGAVRLC